MSVGHLHYKYLLNCRPLTFTSHKPKPIDSVDDYTINSEKITVGAVEFSCSLLWT